MDNKLIVNPFMESAKDYINVNMEDIEPEWVNYGLCKVALFKNERKDIMEEVNDKYLKPDLISFYLFAQALSKNMNSREARTFVNTMAELFITRMNKLSQEDVRSLLKDKLEVIEIEINKVKEVKNSSEYYEIEGVRIPIKDLIVLGKLRGGIIGWSNSVEDNLFLVKWNKAVNSINKMYLISGFYLMDYNETKSVLKNVLSENIIGYMNRVKDKVKEANLEVHNNIKRELSKLENDLIETKIKGEDLESKDFPPCIKNIYSGVGAGDRNFGITVLLTSFLSYARLSPTSNVFSEEFRAEFSDKEIDILQKEVMPSIELAASRCIPPLFEDQPEEKTNVNYHLGFGLGEIILENFGKSKWYLPPSCEKVRQAGLCCKDRFCNENFYVVAKRESLEEAKGETLGEKLIKAGSRMRTIEELEKHLNIKKEDIQKQMRILVQNKMIVRKNISNPLIYYMLKRRGR